MQNCGREEPKIGNGARNVEPARERERFAGVDRFRPRELLEIAFDQLCDAKKNFRALRGRFPRPINERLLRRSGGKIDIARVAVRDLRIRLARRRFDVVEIFSTDRLSKLAIDEISDLR